jgi:SAM-dependent methyltransferase
MGVQLGEALVEHGPSITLEAMVTLTVDLELAEDEARNVLADELGGLDGLFFRPVGSGTRVTFEHSPELGPAELAGWFAALVRAADRDSYEDWYTDRVARRPSGAQAREVYADPLYHWPNFLAILAELDLDPDDRLLEVGCGGGAFLRRALESGCSAAAVDHSPEMVRLARELNTDAVAAGRLEIVESDAASLPFADESFSAAVMTGVLGFLPDPVAAFAEIRRVLAPGGRLVVLGSDPALKGTPAAPEPVASRLAFYTDEEHQRLARQAGFEDVRVARISLGEYAREAGIPAEHVGLFEGPTPFLLARKN